MSEASPLLNRRGFLASSASIGASSLFATSARAEAENSPVRPFHINVPEEALIDLRRRIDATRWPERETVTDESQGVQLATIQEIARYWATDYNWRKVEARLNALPQFITEIDGLDIHSPAQAGLSDSFRFSDQKGRTQMIMLIKTLAAVAAGTIFATNAFAQSTRAASDTSPYVAIENETPPKLIVDPTPLAAGLAHDIVWIQYHAENVRILPAFGAGALNVSPRIGHLHVHLDDLPWGWVEATSDNNTISVAGLPPGQHKMLVELVDANHHLFPGCAECRQTVTFTVPETTSHH